MQCSPDTIGQLQEEFCGFCDSVVLSYQLEAKAGGIRGLTIVLRCHNQKHEEAFIEMAVSGVEAWCFSCRLREAAEVVTEGFRFAFDGSHWLIDFGEDPETQLAGPDWMDHSTRWIVGSRLRIRKLKPERPGTG